MVAWQAYWGNRPTGLLGAPLEFAGTVSANQLPRLGSGGRNTIGADPELLRYPQSITFEQLPLLIQRLRGATDR